MKVGDLFILRPQQRGKGRVYQWFLLVSRTELFDVPQWTYIYESVFSGKTRSDYAHEQDVLGWLIDYDCVIDAEEDSA